MDATAAGRRQEDHAMLTALDADPDETISADDMDYGARLDIEAQLLCALLWAQPVEAQRVIVLITAADFDGPIYGALFSQIAELVVAGKPTIRRTSLSCSAVKVSPSP